MKESHLIEYTFSLHDLTYEALKDLAKDIRLYHYLRLNKTDLASALERRIFGPKGASTKITVSIKPIAQGDD